MSLRLSRDLCEGFGHRDPGIEARAETKANSIPSSTLRNVSKVTIKCACSANVNHPLP